jgi:Cu(I)/Ag(I) efflux system membrane protein CusA/SilA
MVGGVITSTVMNLLVYPAIYFIWRSRSLALPRPPVPPLARRLLKRTAIEGLK